MTAHEYFCTLGMITNNNLSFFVTRIWKLDLIGELLGHILTTIYPGPKILRATWVNTESRTWLPGALSQVVKSHFHSELCPTYGYGRRKTWWPKPCRHLLEMSGRRNNQHCECRPGLCCTQINDIQNVNPILRRQKLFKESICVIDL